MIDAPGPGVRCPARGCSWRWGDRAPVLRLLVAVPEGLGARLRVSVPCASPLLVGFWSASLARGVCLRCYCLLLVAGRGCAVVEWRRAQRSVNNGQCVELTRVGPGLVAIRDSKDPGNVHLFDEDAFRKFLAQAKAGDFDDLMVD